jgi:hypothetical protein
VEPYAAGGIGYDVPSRILPADVGVSFTAATGYSWFGHQSLDLGGLSAPAYLNWQAGVTITHKMINLDLRYQRHQSLERELFRLHRRSQRAAGRPPRSRHQSGWPDLTLVRSGFRRKALVRAELAARQAGRATSRCFFALPP